MSVEQPSTKRSKKADATANASGSTVSAAVDVNDHKHMDASLTLLRTQDGLIALAGLPLDHDLVIDNFKLRRTSDTHRGSHGQAEDNGRKTNGQPQRRKSECDDAIT